MLSAATGAAGAVELVPHRALYKMSLDTAASSSDVADARGAMLYKFADGCEAWIAETNVYLRLQYEDGDEIETTWSFASWESKDGLSYRFRIRHNRNGEPIEFLQGDVSRQTEDGSAQARFSSPEGTVIELPAGTLFPTSHLIALLDEERSGERFMSTVFDGASLENPYEINTVFTGKAKRAASARLVSAAGLPDKPARRVRMAFFPRGSREPLPEFELGVDYRDDGIAEHIRQDFGEFILDLKPASIEVLDRPSC